MNLKNILEYLLFIGPFLIIGLSLLAILVILLLRTKTVIKIIAILLLLAVGMHLAHFFGRKIERNNWHFRYFLRFKKIFLEFNNLAQQNEYEELTIKLKKLTEEFPKTADNIPKLIKLTKYLTTPLEATEFKSTENKQEIFKKPPIESSATQSQID